MLSQMLAYVPEVGELEPSRVETQDITNARTGPQSRRRTSGPELK